MIMETPFVFGRLADTVNFTNRKKEQKILKENFLALNNTIIISPRRWGKSSLVSFVANSLQKEDTTIKICKIDLFNIRNEEDFYTVLAQNILQTTSSSKIEELVTNTKKFLSHLLPKISFSADGQSEISFGFEWNDIKNKPDEILDLAENIAKEKKIKIIVCIDEFQNIAEFENPLYFQRKLRSHFQQHQNVAYCLYGSKRHMMMDVFTNASMPFYKFGSLLFLEKIETKIWIDFIRERFAATHKSIDEPQAALICQLVENHSYYVQQLAQQVWLRTSDFCSDDVVYESHQSIINQLSLLFISMTENLTENQLNFLKALLNGETVFSSQNTLQKYHLGNSSNITRVKKALIDKDILDDTTAKIEFQDPMYKHWLKREYFKIQETKTSLSSTNPKNI